MLVRGVCDFQVLQDYGAVAIHLHQVLVVIFNCAQQRQFVVGTLAYYMGKNGELVSVCTRSFHENEMRGFQMFCLYFTQSVHIALVHAGLKLHARCLFIPFNN